MSERNGGGKMTDVTSFLGVFGVEESKKREAIMLS